jgi:hypothetical protein
MSVNNNVHVVQHLCKCAFVGYHVGIKYSSMHGYGTQSGLALFIAMGTHEMRVLPQLTEELYNNVTHISTHLYKHV